MKTDLTTFSQMPDNARTWVYQSSRAFTDEEVAQINELGQKFISGWAAHGAQLNAAFDVLYDRFLVLTVDEEQAGASGCSIDSSVKFIKESEAQFNIDLMDRLNLAYLNKDAVETVQINQLSEKYEEGVLTNETTVFNNIITSFSELKTDWRIPLIESWAGERLRSSIV